MARKMKFRGPKDPFSKLDDEFKEAVAHMQEPEARDRIAKITMDTAALLAQKSNDQDLKAKQSIAREAGAVYREATKMNGLRVELLRRRLGELGKPNGESPVALPNA